MKWRVAAGRHPGTLTSGAPLISSTSGTGAPAPLGRPRPRPLDVSSLLRAFRGASPTPPPPPPAKPAAPTVHSGPRHTDCLALTLAPYLHGVPPGRPGVPALTGLTASRGPRTPQEPQGSLPPSQNWWLRGPRERLGTPRPPALRPVAENVPARPLLSAMGRRPFPAPSPLAFPDPK